MCVCVCVRVCVYIYYLTSLHEEDETQGQFYAEFDRFNLRISLLLDRLPFKG